MSDMEESCTHVGKAFLLLFLGGKDNLVELQNLRLVLSCSHPVAIDKAHVLTGVPLTRIDPLVMGHEVTPSEEVTQVELPGSPSLTPPALEHRLPVELLVVMQNGL